MGGIAFQWLFQHVLQWGLHEETFSFLYKRWPSCNMAPPPHFFAFCRSSSLRHSSMFHHSSMLNCYVFHSFVFHRSFMLNCYVFHYYVLHHFVFCYSSMLHYSLAQIDISPLSFFLQCVKDSTFNLGVWEEVWKHQILS